MSGSGRRRGRVHHFDHTRGLGEIVGADGATVPFHCVEILDGSRTIETGSVVEFGVCLKLGRPEAVAVTVVPEGPAG